MKLASLEIVKSVKKHPNADSLDILNILGWQTICKRGEFKEGDKIIFIIIDTILPDMPWSEFLKDKKNPDKLIRLRNAKIRGEYSQGLCLPLSILDGNSFAAASWQVGADVGAELGIKKYEKELPASLSGEIIGTFPTYLVSKTDEDNGLSNPNLVDEVLKRRITVTKKMDGSSVTIIIKNGNIDEVCSRNFSLRESTTNAFWKVARKLNIPLGWNGAIQGEVCGVGINGNVHNIPQPTLFVFQILTEEMYMTYHNMEQFCIQNLKCNVVPLVGYYDNNLTLDNLIEIADNQITDEGIPSEGIVVRPSDYRSSGIGRPLGFKLINRNYRD